MNLYTIDTGFFKLDGGAMFGVVPKVIWQKINEPDSKNLCTWSMRCLLVEEGDRLVLIDTGLGDKQSDKFFSHYYPHGDDTLEKSLAKHGFHKNDITDVFLTHLHFDHCGGAIERKNDSMLVPAFPNAKFWVHSEHWDWAVNPNPREKASFLKENIQPMQESGQLQLITNETELFPGFEWLKMNGHTEAQLLPKISYRGKILVYMADLIPSHGHIHLPFVMAYDVRPLQTISEKQSFLEEAVDDDYVLFYEHDKDIACSTLKKTDKGFRMGEALQLSDL
jgi:glyoxylase-like metal-dependent hydrolase (beta-lactamase superfamily II)